MARYALVIGIGENRSPLSSISQADADAEAMAKLLEAHGNFRVTLLRGRVSKAELAQAFKQFWQQATNAEALIFYSGHGLQIFDEFDPPEVVLAASDCGIKTQGRQIVGHENGLKLNSLNRNLAEARFSNLVMLLDCCHSGYLLEKEPLRQMFAAFQDRDYVLLTACRSHEQAWAMNNATNSVFTEAVLEGLAEAQADAQGMVTAERLIAFVKEQLRQGPQEPVSLGVGRELPIVQYRRGVQPVLDESVCPYQGLNAFMPETKQFFFGRDGVVLELLRKLQDCNFVLVIGPSGIGKSSIVRAGVVPRLLEQGWRILGPIKPGPEPMGELKRAFRAVFGEREIAEVYRQIEEEGLWPVVERLQALADGAAGQRFLLVIDQFEEVFTVCINPEQRQRFIAQLVTVGTNRVRPPGADSPAASVLSIVTTMRSDFVNDWLATGQPTQVIQEQTVYVGPLQGQGLRDAIVKPAERLGYGFGAGLLELILADVESERNCLPLLEFALSELWAQRDRQKRLLTAAAYQQMGRLQGALDARVEAVYGSLNEVERDWARRVCLQLVRIGKGETDTRQRQLKGNLLKLASGNGVQERQIVDVMGELVRGRLLVSDGAVSSDGEDGGATIDLAHEALMGGWGRFVEWRQQDRDRLRLRQKVEDALEEWEERGRNEKYLIQGGLLAELQALEGDERAQVLVTADLRDFFKLSDEAEQKSAAALKQALAIANLREARTRILSLPPAKVVDQTLMAIATVGESLEQLQEAITPVQDALNQAWSKIQERLKLEGHKSAVTCVAFSPQGDRIISGSPDNTLRLWDLEGRTIGEPFQGHTNLVLAVAFSPQGDRIISGSRDNTLRLWDLEGRTIGEPFQGHTNLVLAVAFSPQGDRIISGSGDNTLRLWDLEGRTITLGSGSANGEPFQGHTNSVYAVAFSPQGDRIISGSRDNTLRLWDLEGRTIGEPFQGHSDGVWAVAFSPTGNRIISGSGDNTLRLWDLEGRTIGEPFQGHSGSVLAVAFSPTGNRIISSSGDNTLRLWDLEGRTIGEPFQGHSGSVLAVAFSPTGDRIISGSDDHTLRLWDLEGRTIGEPFQGHSDSVTAVAFSPTGDRIISGSDDHTLRLWDLEGRTIGEPFQGHSDGVWAVAFSPTGDRIISGSEDNTLRLWDLEGRTITLGSGSANGEPFQGHSDGVWAVAFSPTGDRIISGSRDSTLRLWDLEGRTIGEPFQGHSDWVWAVAFSPTGDRIISGSRDSTLRLWDLEGRTITWGSGSANGEAFQGHSDSVRAVAFSPTGDRIVSGSNDGTLRLWDLEGRTIGEPFQGHSGSVWAVAFSPTGDRIISGSEDNTLRLWDLEGRTIGEPFQGHSDWVWAVAFSPTGDRIISGSRDNTLRLWRGGTWQDWLRDCCNQLMFHSDLVVPKTDYAHQACEVCKTHAWTRPETARFLRAQAHHLQRQGNTAEATTKLAEAERLERKDQG